ncbi:phage antirepressor KilAC domain-containing protein [Kineosporia sp. NBRC 101731]|uniref:phage antirepressor KilAC domain-containing protein n=1 Tax=Kineosporia sp. NBRC 101731 TaxID=3032199 RepID=UPI0024A07D78|nr:phage antirepressor KilAC domain-containing protein [Kineosporia sp. NBRC 101731]GLY32009.1 antirepressor [Kineosporia sp. NBRC 101731]
MTLAEAKTSPFVFNGREVHAFNGSDGKPWFWAADVCRELEIKNISDAVASLDGDEKGLATADTPGGSQQVRIINEPGMWSLVLRSRKPEAKAFKRWITHEVIPVLRVHGAYSIPGQRQSPVLPSRRELAQMVIEVEDALAASEQKVAKLEPKAAYVDRVILVEGDLSVRDTAQILKRDHGLDVGEHRLFARLREWKWIGADRRPYQRYIECGWLSVKEQSYEHPKTGERTAASPQVRVTARGRLEIHQRLAAGQTALELESGAL